MIDEQKIIAQALDILNYCYPVIVVIGTLANILAFIIFSRKKFQKTIFSTYFRILLIIDTIGLVYLAMGKFLYFKFGINVRNFNEHFCRLTLLLAYSIPPISAYILVAISIDRFISIAKPTLFLFRRKASFQIGVCIFIIAANLLYSGQLFFSYLAIDYLEDPSVGPVCLIPYEKTLQTMDLFNSTIIPFLLMIVSTILTIKSVFDSRKKMSQSTKQNKSNNQVRRKDIKFSITSITLNITFLLLNLPFAISSLIDNRDKLIPILADLIVLFLLFLTYLNNGSVFFVNLSVNCLFREEIIALFGKKINRNHIQK
jgi:hypothetical protein